jgi:hypothetical protein
MGSFLFLGFVIVGYGGPGFLLIWLMRHRMVSRAGVVIGLAALFVVIAWAWHDISTSESSTAALGFLVLPPVLFVVAAGTFLVDRVVVLGWRLARRVGPSRPVSPGPRDPDDWSVLP